MKVKVLAHQTVGDLIDLKRNGILKVNYEYQRGLRWTNVQKQMFIDSVFRGYSIPAFYFHKKQVSAADITNTFYEIVDGQQRIDALYSYREGAFSLLNKLKFPDFVQHVATPWAGKRFTELHDTEKKKLRDHVVVVFEITTTNDNEIRDLFIRLQAGTPLTSQDKRDSWPGSFTEFVLTAGGKQDVEQWYGWSFFKNVAKVSNESRRRQLVAQSFMLYWMLKKEVKFVDIKSSNLDDFYHAQVGFDQGSPEATTFRKICDTLNESFSSTCLVGHYVIHLILLIDSLLDEYVEDTWTHKIVKSWRDFENRLRDATDANKQRLTSDYEEYYAEYGQWINNRSDNASSIRRRHAFFAKEMLYLIRPERSDPGPSFTELERKLVFFRDHELCQFCKMSNDEDHRVSWAECAIHQVTPYGDGQTQLSMENAALMHLTCCPTQEYDVTRFRKWWVARHDQSGHNFGGFKSDRNLVDLTDAIHFVLSRARRPLHFREITAQLRENDIWRLEGLTPENTVAGRISESISGPGPRFRRLGGGMYEAI